MFPTTPVRPKTAYCMQLLRTMQMECSAHPGISHWERELRKKNPYIILYSLRAGLQEAFFHWQDVMEEVEKRQKEAREKAEQEKGKNGN
jgi:hypothetical protein